MRSELVRGQGFPNPANRSTMFRTIFVVVVGTGSSEERLFDRLQLSPPSLQGSRAIASVQAMPKAWLEERPPRHGRSKSATSLQVGFGVACGMIDVFEIF